MADTYLCMGNTYLELGKHSDAFDNFKESISIREGLIRDTGTSTREMSFISDLPPLDDHIALQYSKLIECFEAFLPLYKRLHNDPEMTVKYLQKMGECYFQIHDYDHAMGRCVGRIS